MQHIGKMRVLYQKLVRAREHREGQSIKADMMYEVNPSNKSTRAKSSKKIVFRQKIFVTECNTLREREKGPFS